MVQPEVAAARTTPTVVAREAIARNNIAVEYNPVAEAIYSLIGRIMDVVIANPAVMHGPEEHPPSNLETFDHEPADRGIIACPDSDRLHDRMLIRVVAESNRGSVLSRFVDIYFL